MRVLIVRHDNTVPKSQRSRHGRCDVNQTQAACSGRQVRSGMRQSMPSSSIDNCAGLRLTLPPSAWGQMKRPFSRRLLSRHSPWPSHHSSLMMSPRRPRKTNTWPPNGSCSKTSCATTARPSKPLRMSVWPAASQTRVPAGKPIMAVRATVAGCCADPAWQSQAASARWRHGCSAQWAAPLLAEQVVRQAQSPRATALAHGPWP